MKLAGDKKLTVPLHANVILMCDCPFEGALPVQRQGAYEVTVTAYDPVTGNTGADSTTFIVEGG